MVQLLIQSASTLSVHTGRGIGEMHVPGRQFTRGKDDTHNHAASHKSPSILSRKPLLILAMREIDYSGVC